MKLSPIEIFICVVVVAILAAVAIPAYLSDENICRRAAKERHEADEKLKADPTSLAEALQACSALKRH